MPPAPRFTELCVELLNAGVPVRFTATGPSMAPTIHDGDVITVAPARVDEIEAGDVTLYAAPRGLTAHRVVARTGGPTPAFVTRGDAPGSEDALVAGKTLLGRVLRVERRRFRVSDLRLTRWMARVSFVRGWCEAVRRACERFRRSGRIPGGLPDNRLDAGRAAASPRRERPSGVS